MARVWTVGDPEPEDHPDVVAGDDKYGHMLGPYHYHWEAPHEENGWRGGWWCCEFAGDLWDWEDVLAEEGVVTEDLDPCAPDHGLGES